MAPEITKVVPLTCHGHSRPITHISFSAVVEEGEYYLATACKDNSPMLRNGVTGDWVGTFLGHKGAVWQSRLSADATLCATGSADFSAKVWDALSGEAMHTLQHDHIVRAVAFPAQRDPKVVATGGHEKKLRIYDLSGHGTTTSAGAQSNGASSPACYEVGAGVHQGVIKSILWAPNDPNLLITAADDKKIRWWDLRSRTMLKDYEVEGPIGSCELNTITSTGATPNGLYSPQLAIGFEDGLLSVASGKSVYFFQGPSHPGSLIKSHKLPKETACVAIHAKAGKFVTGGSGDTWVHVWDMETGQEEEVGKGHHGPVWTVCFSPDGRLYGTGSEDGTVKLWKFGGGGTGPYGLWQ